MSRENVANRVAAIISPVIEDLGIELVDVEYLKEGPEWYLRVYIDQDEGIGLQECERVSKAIDKILDEHDHNNSLIPGSYYLEVSSPGLTRPLKREKDFLKHIGKLVTVKTYAPINKKKEFNGILLGYGPDGIELEIDDEKLTLAKNQVSLVHLTLKF